VAVLPWTVFVTLDGGRTGAVRPGGWLVGWQRPSAARFQQGAAATM
jgi:hypothetical protein